MAPPIEEYLVVTFKKSVATDHSEADSLVRLVLAETAPSVILSDPFITLARAQTGAIKEARIIRDTKEVRKYLQSSFVRAYRLSTSGEPVIPECEEESPELKQFLEDVATYDGVSVLEEEGPAFCIRKRDGQELLKLQYAYAKSRSTTGAIKVMMLEELGKKHGLKQSEMLHGLEMHKDADHIMMCWAGEYSKAVGAKVAEESIERIVQHNPANKFSWKQADADSAQKAIKTAVKAGLDAPYIARQKEPQAAQADGRKQANN
jgi:hypothetical protein